MNFTEFNSDTGEIGGVHSGFNSADDALSQVFMQGMDAVIEGEYSSLTYYILDGQPTERPIQSTTLTGATLTDLPIPCTLQVNGEGFEVDDGEAELDFLLPGTYSLRVEAWPYQDWEAEVTV